MSPRPLRIGLSSCMMHPDPTRNLFKGKRLLYTEESMFHWLMSEGDLAYLLPTVSSQGATLRLLIEAMDGIVMTGGVDVAPETYGEVAMSPEWAGDRRRDDYEAEIIRLAMELGKPILGICRGLQIINVALGGSLFQDIKTQNPEALIHRDWDTYDENFHALKIEPKSALEKLYPLNREATINSVHHQAIKDLAEGLVIEARSPVDGIIEAVRLAQKLVDDPYVSAVQWHPEFQWLTNAALLDPGPLLRDFLNEARRRLC